MTSAAAPRGMSHPLMRLAECKDCLREVVAGRRPDGSQFFTYPEAWAGQQLERGDSRSDRCHEHRATHRSHISGVAVAYIDLDTTGEVSDRDRPAGPLGALGPLPPAHRVANTPGVELGKFGFGMDETHIARMLEHLADPESRVLIVKAGTGTGKSTYMPYKLLDPPEGCFRLADLGPIVVTEPRVQATVGVASFVGSVMSGAGGVGAGYPVGYQVSGDRQHDPACRLVYVTDGTMINWLREGRLSLIGTVIVDEAHERSTNIDFIMGYLRRELGRYPHLRVIITSATFDAEFYRQYFDASTRAEIVEIPAVKSIGYGWPLFPELDARPAGDHQIEAWTKMAPELALADEGAPPDAETFIARAWPRFADPLTEDEVLDPGDAGYIEDLHETTRALMALRLAEPVAVARWQREMPTIVAEFVVRLTVGLDRNGIFGDILAFLPTSKAIEQACDLIRANLGGSADVYALQRSLTADEKAVALAARRKGDRRKIVIATNLAETSLTVEGVRFVVDSGLIAQSEWDVDAAQGGIRTKTHSQAGIKQRWGRVGRKAPGWVFPLYGKDQLLDLAEDTPPGSARENLENLVMTAKLGGLASVHDIVWPAQFEPKAPVVLDEAARAARKAFVRELERADAALRRSGALDADGDPTSLGKELSRLQVLSSTAAALAVMYADRLACVPEVATILALLDGKNLVSPTGLLQNDLAWPDEWRVEAAERHRTLASACEDDAELVLQIAAGWERADPGTLPWEPSPARAVWAARWWVDHDVLLAAAAARRDILANLSPMMKEQVKRFVEPALLRRARGALTRAYAGLEHRFDGAAFTAAPAAAGEPDAAIRTHATVLTRPPERCVPLHRSRHGGVTYLANFVTAEPWALDGAAESANLLLAASARHAGAEAQREVTGALLEGWPGGGRARLSFSRGADGRVTVAAVHARHDPAATPAPAAQLAEQDSADALAHGGGTPADVSPELDTRWPAPNPPYPDPDAAARRAVLDHREVEAEEYACRRCPACLVGDLTTCADRREQAEPAGAGDALAVWRSRGSSGIDVSSPFVAFDDDSEARDGDWYEVVGYRDVQAGDPVVVLRRDWRRPDHTAGPGEHPDLEAGQRVEVVAGGTIRDHHDDLRVLVRADGKGRFLLREADRDRRRQAERAQLAIALNSYDTGQLADLRAGATLTATVLPRSHAGHFTATLLDLAAQHADEAGQGRTHPAVMASAPNAHKFADVRLLAVDTSSGLRHVLSAQVDADAPPVGAAVLVDLKPARTRLSLQGRRLQEVREVVDRRSDLRMIKQPEDVVLGTSGCHLVPVGSLSSATARELAELELDITWSRDVWLLWARSRHREATRLRPGDHSDPIDIPARPRAELSAETRLPVAQVRSLHPVGSRTTAVVTTVNDDLNRAWLRLPDGVPASVAAKHVPGAAGDLLSEVLSQGREIVGWVIRVFDKGGKGNVTLTLLDPSGSAAPPAVTSQPRTTSAPGVFDLTSETDPGELADALVRFGRLAVSFAGLPTALVPAYAAYLLGLASALATGTADWADPLLMVVAWPDRPIAPPTSLQNAPQPYTVRSFDGSIDALARTIRLGHPVEIRMHDAEPSVQSTVRLFVAGVCAALPINVEVDDGGRVLHVYRR